MLNKPKRTRGLGELEIRVLSYIQFKKMDVLRFGDLREGLNINIDQERRILSRLESKGQVVRLKKGVYLVSLRLPPGGRLSFSEYYMLAKFMEVEGANYQISGQTVFNQYGFDEQVPNRIFAYNDRISGRREIGGFWFDFVKTTPERLGGSYLLKESTGLKIPVATREKTLVDAVYDWPRFNTLPRAFSWIVSSLKEDRRLRARLIETAIKCGNRAVIRRIGCLLEHNGVARQGLKKLKEELGKAKSLIPLVPGKPVRGSVDRFWGVIINDQINF